MAPVCDGLIFRPSFLAMMRRARPTICCGAQTPVQLWSTALHNELGKVCEQQNTANMSAIYVYMSVRTPVCTPVRTPVRTPVCMHVQTRKCVQRQRSLEIALYQQCVCVSWPAPGLKWHEMAEASGNFRNHPPTTEDFDKLLAGLPWRCLIPPGNHSSQSDDPLAKKKAQDGTSTALLL